MVNTQSVYLHEGKSATCCHLREWLLYHALAMLRVSQGVCTLVRPLAPARCIQMYYTRNMRRHHGRSPPANTVATQPDGQCLFSPPLPPSPPAKAHTTFASIAPCLHALDTQDDTLSSPPPLIGLVPTVICSQLVPTLVIRLIVVPMHPFSELFVSGPAHDQLRVQPQDSRRLKSPLLARTQSHGAVEYLRVLV